MSIVPTLLLVTLTVLAGWAALWPLRANLGPFAYHVGAFPLGLLSWTFVSSVAVIVGFYTALTVGAGLLLFVFSINAVLSRVTAGPEGAGALTVRAGTFIAAAAAYLGAASLISIAGITATTADSWKGYWPPGVMIEVQAAFTAYMVSARGHMLPSVSAASLFFGNEWEYVVYPMLGGVLLLGVLGILLRSELRPAGRVATIAIAGGVLLYIATDPSFLYHSLYVHSHLMSAVYLLFALGGIRSSFDPGSGQSVPGAPAWLATAGLATAGLGMTRPDGLAYAFIPILVAVAVLADSRRSGGGAGAFFAPLLLALGVPLAASYAEVGLWQAAKLSGIAAGALYLLIALAALVPALLRGATARTGIVLRSEHVVRAAIAAAAGLVLVVAIVRWEIMSLALLNARANLFGANGAYAYLWPSLAAVVAASVLSGDALRRGRWSAHLFGTIVLFFLVAALVHGTSHPGRIGTGDSFSRVAFHIVPVLVWYVATVVARVSGDLGVSRRAA